MVIEIAVSSLLGDRGNKRAFYEELGVLDLSTGQKLET
ncbi:MAG: hypothetical protein F6K11_33035 [Leptolyngbya sp. SIO3F4]|nr:hypothetical protein [Leptolyngbya sp. SIO3F4]